MFTTPPRPFPHGAIPGAPSNPAATPILVRAALRVATMDDAGTEHAHHDILLAGGRIAQIGTDLTAPPGTRVIDAAGHVALPGFVNCHHHLFQTLTRAVPRTQDAELFDWLTGLYEVWREVTPELAYISALVGLGELMLTGCATSTDHLYLFPRAADGRLIDAEIRAARELGIRFHPTRGCMTRGKSQGGLPPDDVCQTRDEILADCERLVDDYHDPSPLSMLRIAVAPCSPFSVDLATMVELAAFARRRGVRLHTHMAETRDEEDYCMSMYGLRPIPWAEKVGWLGSDVWFAHVVHANADDIARLACTGTGVAHCPASNMRLGSGIPPIRAMLDAGVKVGLGVDGSASNDTGDLWGEARQAMLLQRVAGGAGAMGAREALRMATRGGAEVLGYGAATGRIVEGAAADIILIDTRKIGFAGAMHDPVAAMLFAGDSHIVDWSIVNGEVVVENGRLARATEEDIVTRANDAAREMMSATLRRTGTDMLRHPASRG